MVKIAFQLQRLVTVFGYGVGPLHEGLERVSGSWNLALGLLAKLSA